MHIQRLPKVFKYPQLSQEPIKSTNFKFCAHIHRIDRNKSPLKITGKVAVGVLRDSRKFSGHPAHRAVLPAIARHLVLS